MGLQDFKLCAVVITYYPDTEETKTNIMKYLPWVDHLLIWENTPVEKRDEYQLNFPNIYKDKITFLGEKENEFISYPLNRAVEWAQLNGYTHILTMDQDSTWEHFEGYKNEVIKNILDSKIFAPNVNNKFNTCKNIKREYSITSGTIYALDLFEKIGNFDELYQIDGVDIEFGMRAYKEGFSTLFLTNYNLKQQFGKTESHGKIKVSNYSSIRRYYIMRNDIWLYKKYRKDLPISKRNYIRKELFNETYKILRYEQNKFMKLKTLYKGLYDGLFAYGRNN